MTATPPELLPDVPDVCWPVDVSCIPDFDADPAVYTEAEKARALALAVQSLRMLTAFSVGGCPVVVRPASQTCRGRTWRAYTVGVSSVSWIPVNLGGEWLNIGCSHGACGCQVIPEVRLGRASHVIEVKVDGVVLDPSAYRLDPGGRLVRLDGEGWPLCQDLTAPDTLPGTWSVTFQRGAPVDGIGAWVAGLLAREYLKACTDGDCDLPSTVTQVVRQGVTLTLAPGAFPDGLTGIREVDAWIERYNPHRHKVAPAVYSPELARPRQIGGPSTAWTPIPSSIDGGSA